VVACRPPLPFLTDRVPTGPDLVVLMSLHQLCTLMAPLPLKVAMLTHRPYNTMVVLALHGRLIRRHLPCSRVMVARRRRLTSTAKLRRPRLKEVTHDIRRTLTRCIRRIHTTGIHTHTSRIVCGAIMRTRSKDGLCPGEELRR